MINNDYYLLLSIIKNYILVPNHDDYLDIKYFLNR